VQVQLTRAGHALHGRLLKVVIAFNQQLRTGLSRDDIETLRRLLGVLQRASPSATLLPEFAEVCRVDRAERLTSCDR
jgi:hypothetical protein